MAVPSDTALNRKFRLRTLGAQSFVESIVTVDTGAAVSLAFGGHPLVQNAELRPVKLELRAAFGGTVKCLGQCDLEIELGSRINKVTFVVVELASFSFLLGWPDLQRLKFEIGPNFISVDGEKVGTEVRAVNVQRQGNCAFVEYSDVFAVENVVSDTDDLEKLPYLQPEVTVESDVDLVKLVQDYCAENDKVWSSSVTESQKSQIKNLLLRYKHCFAKSKVVVGNIPESVGVFEQEFTTVDPPACKIWPIDSHKAKLIDDEIQKLIEMNVVEPCDDRIITSNILLVPKKGSKELRAVIDLRAVNKVTRKINLVLPKLNEIITSLNGSKFYLSSDIVKAFWSLSVPVSQRHWYTLHSPLTRRVFRFCKMPMGAVNSAAIFQNVAEQSLRPEENNMHIYIDDINGSYPDFKSAFKSLELFLAKIKNFEKKNLLKK